MLAILFTGLIGTAQLILHYSHEPKVEWNVDDNRDDDSQAVEREIQPIDIYGGYFIGFVAMAIAIYFMF